MPECLRVHCPYKSVVATPIENNRKLKRKDIPSPFLDFTEENTLFIHITQQKIFNIKQPGCFSSIEIESY